MNTHEFPSNCRDLNPKVQTESSQQLIAHISPILGRCTNLKGRWRLTNSSSFLLLFKQIMCISCLDFCLMWGRPLRTLKTPDVDYRSKQWADQHLINWRIWWTQHVFLASFIILQPTSDFIWCPGSTVTVQKASFWARDSDAERLRSVLELSHISSELSRMQQVNWCQH